MAIVQCIEAIISRAGWKQEIKVEMAILERMINDTIAFLPQEEELLNLSPRAVSSRPFCSFYTNLFQTLRPSREEY